MKKLIRMTFSCTIAALVLTLLPACDQEQTPAPKVAVKPAAPAKPAPPADTGLVPDLASTGNPPLIPHDVDESDGGEECLECHENDDYENDDHEDGDRKDGDRKDDDDAPKMPAWHATLTDCRQCHVPAVESTTIFKTQY